MTLSRKKEKKLVDNLQKLNSVLVAFSGGVDSTYLAWAARKACGDNTVALTAVSSTISRSEIEEAKIIAKKIGIEHHCIATHEMDDRNFTDNPPDRCYYCKRHMFTIFKEWACRVGMDYIVAGETVDDDIDWRPGQRAMKELGIRNPLKEVGLTKSEVRELSRHVGLPTSEKPSLACLASRIPYGTKITRGLLNRIDDGEHYIKRITGIKQLRLRHHGNICRLEISPEEMSLILNPTLMRDIADYLKKLGYLYVTLDLEGYRNGAMNEKLGTEF